MSGKRTFRYRKTWIALALAAMIFAPTGSILATSGFITGDEDTALPQVKTSSATSDDKENDITIPTEENKTVAILENEDASTLPETNKAEPTPVAVPFAAYALPDLSDVNLSNSNISYLYNMEKLKTEVVLFTTTIETVSNIPAESGIFSEDSQVELSLTSPIAEIGFTGFDTKKSTVGAQMEIYANGDSSPFYSKEITSDHVSVTPPEGTTECKVRFTKDVYSNKQLIISTYANMNMNSSSIGEATFHAKATINKNGGNIIKEGNSEFKDIEEPLTDRLIKGLLQPTGSTIVTPESLKNSPKVDYNMNYNLTFQSNDYRLPVFLRLKDTEFQSNTDEDMILKTLKIHKGFAGYLASGFKAADTYDVYINDVLFKKDQPVQEDLTIEFNDDVHREFKIVMHNDGVQLAGTNRNFTKDLSMVYECKGDGSKGAYPIYVEGKTNVGKNIISSLDHKKDYGIVTYFLQTPFLKNESTKKVHSVGENIIFNLTDVYASKFIGDYSYVNLTLDTSTNLNEYYYLKQVDLVPIARPKDFELIDLIKLQLHNNTTNKVAEGGKISKELYTYTNSDELLSSSQLSGLRLKPGVNSINRNMLSSDPYTYFAAVSGLDLSDFTVKLTYAPRADKTITENMIFTNEVSFSMGPNNNLADPLTKNALILGTTEIRIASDPGDSGNPDVDKPDTGNPDVENPDVENPDVDKPDTGNPDVDKPDTGNPDVENPDTGKPDSGKPSPGAPDSSNQQTPTIDSSNKGANDKVDGNKPATGDETYIGLWTSVLIFTGLGSIALFRYKNKNSITHK